MRCDVTPLSTHHHRHHTSPLHITTTITPPLTSITPPFYTPHLPSTNPHLHHTSHPPSPSHLTCLGASIDLVIRGSHSTFPSSLSSPTLSKDTVPDGRRTTRRAMSFPVRASVPTSNSTSSRRRWEWGGERGEEVRRWKWGGGRRKRGNGKRRRKRRNGRRGGRGGGEEEERGG